MLPAESRMRRRSDFTAAVRRFLADPSTLPVGLIPSAARARLQALTRATEASSTDPRLSYFRSLLRPTAPESAAEARRVSRVYGAPTRGVH